MVNAVAPLKLSMRMSLVMSQWIAHLILTGQLGRSMDLHIRSISVKEEDTFVNREQLFAIRILDRRRNVVVDDAVTDKHL